MAAAIGTSLLSGFASGTTPSTRYIGTQAGSTSMSSFIKLISILDYLMLTNGVRTQTSDTFLSLFRSNPLEILNNYLEEDESDIHCTPAYNFEREDVSCYIMNNYGSETLSLVGVMTIMLTLLAINSFREKCFHKQQFAYKLIFYLFYLPNLIITPSMWISMLDGSLIEVGRWVALNFYSGMNTRTLKMGMLYSGCYAVVYLAYIICIVKRTLSLSLARQPAHDSSIKKQSSQKENTLFSSEGKNKDDKEESVGEPSSPNRETRKDILVHSKNLELLEYLHEEYKGGLSRNFLYFIPLLLILKDLYLQIVLVLFGGKSNIQLFLLCAGEVVGMILTLISLLVQKGWRKYLKMISSICYVAILAIYIMINTQNYSKVDREKNFGILLCVLYSILIVSVLIPMIVELFQSIIEFFKKVELLFSGLSLIEIAAGGKAKPAVLPLAKADTLKKDVKLKEEGKFYSSPFKNRLAHIVKQNNGDVTPNSIKSKRAAFNLNKMNISVNRPSESSINVPKTNLKPRRSANEDTISKDVGLAVKKWALTGHRNNPIALIGSSNKKIGATEQSKVSTNS